MGPIIFEMRFPEEKRIQLLSEKGSRKRRAELLGGKGRLRFVDDGVMT